MTLNLGLRYSLILLILMISIPVGASPKDFSKKISYYESSSVEFTHEVLVRLVTFSKGGWKASEIKYELEKSAEVYAQCGVHLKIADLIESSDNPEVSFDLEGYTDPNEPHEPYSSLDLAAKWGTTSVPTIFFMNGFDPAFAQISATSMPLLRVQHKDQQMALNSVWMSLQIANMQGVPEGEGGYPAGYAVLAHELGHVLLNRDHETSPHTHNLMHELPGNLNGRFTLEQCTQLKKSNLVRALSKGSRVCSEVNSSLLGKVVFLDELEDACGALKRVTDKLEKFNDSVSDLQPVYGIDFFLGKASDLIQYLDRNAFEASLVPSYDPAGTIKLTETQSDVLWMHEMGHAILNAQLAADWEWFGARSQIYREWGRAVTESTQLEIQLRKMSDTKSQQLLQRKLSELGIKTDQLMKKVMGYPNGYEYDQIMSPYHEMFADAVAVVYTRDPKALKKALLNPEDPDSKMATAEDRQAIEDRDFSYLRETSKWSNAEAHALLTPTQSFFWKKINKPEMSQRSSREILRTLYQVIRGEIIERIQDKKLWNLPPSEINERLMRRINLVVGLQN